MEKFLKADDSGKIAFLEKITSNFTHEINNILSIINEYTGIIDDKIYAYEQKGNLDLEKIKYYTKKVYDQILRGKRINKLLNEFSHLVNEEYKDVEINSEIEKFLELIERIAKINETRFIYDNVNEFNIRINYLSFYGYFFKFCIYLRLVMILKKI